jgi:hypothetical protein
MIRDYTEEHLQGQGELGRRTLVNDSKTPDSCTSRLLRRVLQARNTALRKPKERCGDIRKNAEGRVIPFYMQDRLYITEFARNAANAIEKAKLSREILFGPGKRGKEIPLSARIADYDTIRAIRKRYV